ncbi:PREDICTED: aminopeptidase M1-B-like [Trachymyrmex cornetzi]|uniref:aminopeptidase M1-B-like n=1 Tax=Trachymyrmex cornetzi TaxID=471704 RepID=UPI00084F0F83|nr:PREDICTED: aminopeptidase M1-B-like [Trachymyrmex cornetzi]
MDHISIPNFRQDGISKWGLIFHTEANLICDETLDPITRKMEVARLLAHKIAYQWFSNLLSSAWWSNFWLHDALATMFGEEAVVKSFNNSEILDLFIIQNQYESLHLDSHFNMNPVKTTNLSDINSIFSFPRYMKVMIVLRMFQSAITDEVFRNNIHVYVSRQTFSSKISYNFWSMKEVLNEAYHCNLSSSEFLTWLQYKHYPVVIWEPYKYFEVNNILSQSYIAMNYGKWLIPTILREISSLYVNFKTCLKPNDNSAHLPSTLPFYEVWMVNIQQAGKYLEKPLKTLGYEERLMENDFTKCLRQEIVKWACILQYDECKQSALCQLEQHLHDPARNPLLPWWEHWTYCNGLAIANISMWSNVENSLLKKFNQKSLQLLTCSTYSVNFTSSSFLELFTQDERQNITIIRLYIDTFHSIIMKHSNNFKTLKKIFKNIEIVQPIHFNILPVLVDIINHMYSLGDLMKSGFISV